MKQKGGGKENFKKRKGKHREGTAGPGGGGEKRHGVPDTVQVQTRVNKLKGPETDKNKNQQQGFRRKGGKKGGPKEMRGRTLPEEVPFRVFRKSISQFVQRANSRR